MSSVQEISQNKALSHSAPKTARKKRKPNKRREQSAAFQACRKLIAVLLGTGECPHGDKRMRQDVYHLKTTHPKLFDLLCDEAKQMPNKFPLPRVAKCEHSFGLVEASLRGSVRDAVNASGNVNNANAALWLALVVQRLSEASNPPLVLHMAVTELLSLGVMGAKANGKPRLMAEAGWSRIAAANRGEYYTDKKGNKRLITFPRELSLTQELVNSPWFKQLSDFGVGGKRLHDAIKEDASPVVAQAIPLMLSIAEDTKGSIFESEEALHARLLLLRVLTTEPLAAGFASEFYRITDRIKTEVPNPKMAVDMFHRLLFPTK